MAMLLSDYGDIITDVLCNSHPDFYTDYFKREFKILNEQGYLEREIKYNIEEVIKLIRSKIEKLYNKELATYEKYKEEDKRLPNEKKYNYPKPDINKIPILRIDFPSGNRIDLSGLTKKFYLEDIGRIVEVVNEMFENKTAKPSKLTYLLQLYYEKGCMPLTKPQVEKLATEKNITKTVLVNRWNDLKTDCYQHNGNVNNAKEFIKSYEFLMPAFKESNDRAFKDVQNHYNQLKESYPDLTY